MLSVQLQAGSQAVNISTRFIKSLSTGQNLFLIVVFTSARYGSYFFSCRADAYKFSKHFKAFASSQNPARAYIKNLQLRVSTQCLNNTSRTVDVTFVVWTLKRSESERERERERVKEETQQYAQKKQEMRRRKTIKRSRFSRTSP